MYDLICWTIFCLLEMSQFPSTNCWTQCNDFFMARFRTVILSCLLFLRKTNIRLGTKSFTSKMSRFPALHRSCTATGLLARLIPCHTLALWYLQYHPTIPIHLMLSRDCTSSQRSQMCSPSSPLSNQIYCDAISSFTTRQL